MLSEEEKTTLESIKINNKHKYCGKDDVDFLLNLIKKQQKEIEELKAKNKILEAISLSFNEIQDRDKKWKDKIKAKIKEVSDGIYDAKIVLQSLLKEE